MKNLIIAWLCTILGMLLGGFILCFPQFIPFGATLLAVSGILFIGLGLTIPFVAKGLL